MSLGQFEREIATAASLGSLNAKMDLILQRQDRFEIKLDSVVASTNRWKGATALLMILGGVLGWLGNLFMKAAGKA